jgi:hypothetical protein
MPLVPPARAHAACAAVAAVALAVALAGAPAGAQSAASDADDRVCLGFSFGRWEPRLDLRAAGHASKAPPPAGSTAPGGRDWAGAGGDEPDAPLFLYPAWWPAGVLVRLDGGPPRGVADTVRGTATALVADGRLRAPRTPVRAWGVRCAAAARGGTTPADTSRP